MTTDQLKVMKALSIYARENCQHDENCSNAVKCLLACIKEIERLRADLKLYGEHKDYCGVRWTLESPKYKPCDCGLKTALEQE